MGDYVEGELAERMDRDPLVGNIVEVWGRLAEGRQTVVFATGVKHSIHIAREFQRAGVRAEHLDGNTEMSERDEILRRLYEGELDVVSNCMVLTEGWDCPPVSCCVLARPTKSLGLYLQMAGRTLRPWEGKTDTLLIDHSGAIYEHGFLDQEIPWELEEGGEKITEKVRKKREKEPKQITCPECKAVFISKPGCPFCGWTPKKRGEEYEWVEGELVEVTAKGQKKWKLSNEYKKGFYRELLHIARARGYKDGWAAYRYKKKFGEWPANIWKTLEPKVAGPEVLAYVRHLQIRYAKAKEKERLTA
jgi:superfamily II DNA or RNA helicase